MKQAREYPQVKVSKKAEHAIIKGHPWVYFNEITEAQPFENGELVDVVSQKGSYLGTGFANENASFRDGFPFCFQAKTVKSVFV